MKKFLTVLACTTLLAQNVQGESYIGEQTLKGETLQEASFMGNANLTDIKATSLSVLGSVEFHNLTVEKETSIAGPITKSEKGRFGNLAVVGELDATDITTKKIDVAGAVTVTGLTVTGDANIAGTLTLKAPKDPKIAKNKFQNLNIAAEEISLEDTGVEGKIVVKQPSTFTGGDKKQVLRLLGNTTVKGDVTFESGKGIIEQGPDAIIEGKITGATIEKK